MGIALRGMSLKYTLVLADGQWVAPYRFATGSTDTFGGSQYAGYSLFNPFENYPGFKK